ncbi:amidohydrolase [Sediminicola luteus]|uniref:Hydrolase n=1 Tax=Sediminicola luteus TaxID=319238 RepID=A0A2A4G462_9FLAO|nr:amidohydrolase [Sediminicola luteus]PCE62542.1 hydrolase [Sediminicola luteus]
MKKLVLLLCIGLWINTQAQEPIKELTVYTAKRIITMENALPDATAVAVADGKIVAVGTLETLKAWTDNIKVTYDKTFENKIIMPGFIDTHVHPSLPAILTQFDFIAPEAWQLPTGNFPAALTHEEYVTQLQTKANAFFKKEKDKNIPYITWGYHQLWHGDVYRDKLDELFPKKPVLLWHRSFHEVVLNTAALKLLDMKESDVAGDIHIKYDKGLFSELGAKKIFTHEKLKFMFSPERYGAGMDNFVKMLHMAGVTSAMDMGVGIFGNPDEEIGLIHKSMDRDDVATRIVLTPIITYFMVAGIDQDTAYKKIQEWTKASTPNVSFDDHFKLMLDGAIYSGLSQFNYPGYIDGHIGAWLAPTETTYDWAEYFWNKGFQLHFHTNGDMSTDVLIDHISRMQKQHPRTDHRTALEHFAYATESQLKHLAALDAQISANPYYQFMLADIYAEKWLGEDRARNMVPLGNAKKYGLNIGFHSDCPMAPLSPLTSVWTAVNRETINGNANYESQKLSVYDALRAITIDAAYIMRKEHEIGSIVAGKKADFVILEEDPLKVNPTKLKDIEIWGTVFQGKVFPIDKP